MDTEYDHECARALLSANRSRSDFCELGMKPETAVRAAEHVNYVIVEYENVQLAATDMLNLCLHGRKDKLTKDIDSIKEYITRNTGSWPKKRLDDLQEKVTLSEERLKQVDAVKSRETKYSNQQFKQGVKRIADNLPEESQIKCRKLGQGAHRKVDSDEEFVVKCIENKATSHGRCHNSVLYLNHRVKVKDFRGTVNYF